MTNEDKNSDDAFNGLVMRVTENFHNGDPASPEDVVIEVFHKGKVMESVAKVQIYVDAESDEFYCALLEMAEIRGIDVVGTSNVNNHY